MNDITESILRYRECARHIWNTTFQFLEDGDDDFDDTGFWKHFGGGC